MTLCVCGVRGPSNSRRTRSVRGVDGPNGRSFNSSSSSSSSNCQRRRLTRGRRGRLRRGRLRRGRLHRRGRQCPEDDHQTENSEGDDDDDDDDASLADTRGSPSSSIDRGTTPVLSASTDGRSSYYRGPRVTVVWPSECGRRQVNRQAILAVFSVETAFHLYRPVCTGPVDHGCYATEWFISSVVRSETSSTRWRDHGVYERTSVFTPVWETSRTMQIRTRAVGWPRDIANGDEERIGRSLFSSRQRSPVFVLRASHAYV